MTGSREWSTILKFGLVGASSTLLYFGLLASLREFIPSVFWLTSVSYVVSMAYNYLVQGRYTFQAPGITARSIRRFIAMHLTALLFNGTAMSLLVTTLGLSLYPSQIGVTAMVAAGTYVASKRWVYV